VGQEEYDSLLNKVVDAIVSESEKEIEELGKLNDSITNAQSNLLGAIQQQIDEERNSRENQKIEEDLEDK
jgi:hypothetical protein